MRIVFSILIFFVTNFLNAQVQIGQDIDGFVYTQLGYSVSMPDAQTMAIGVPGLANSNGHVQVYKYDGHTWVQKGQDILGENANDFFGCSLTMPDSNTVAVGAINNDGNGMNAGHVRVYLWNGTQWIQKGQDIDGESPQDNSARSVSMPDANTLAIGASGNDGNGSLAGHVRIFRWSGSTWIQKGNDIDGESPGDNSGYSVSMPDANTVAIGGVSNSANGSSAGHVRIFRWSGSTWIQKGNDIDGMTNDYAGWSVSMPNSNIIAIGAIGVNSVTYAGIVRVYLWNGTQWIQKGQDIDGESLGDNSGYSVSMPDANTVAIGAPNNDGNGNYSGHVRIYIWNGNQWVQKGQDIDGEYYGSFSGKAVNMPDANTVAIGVKDNFENGTNSGHVRVYKLRGIYGRVFQDFNQNCVQDSSEIGINNIVMTITPGNKVVYTNSGGAWAVDSLPAGTYTITIDTTHSNWQLTCPVTQTFTVVHPDSLTHAADFGYVSTNPCPMPEVSIHAPFLRPGFSNQKVYVQACNEALGTDMIDSVYVVVQLDSLLTVDTASAAYTPLGNNQFEVYVGDLTPGQCVSFWFDCTLSTNAVLGQTLCMQADLYPVDSCALDSIPNPFPIGSVSPCTTAWDQSSLQVEAYCNNDSVCFYIYNTGDPGDGDMTCFAPVRVYLDGNYILLDSVQLNGGASTQFCFAGGGRTWRLEVDQHPLHPGNSNPNATVELCGNPANWTPNLVNLFPMDDADPVRDIYCGEVRGSYDPNDKTGFPLGRGFGGEIVANQPLEYRIRFQNTGTDTAFRVVIRDTLPEELNIFTVRSGVASHDYDFRMYGPRVLEWTFNNIMLPDSNVNEPASHGFVKFKVDQVPNLPIGTTINNRVGIYFDFNAPIITNWTEHTIGDPQILNVQTFEEGSIQPNWRAYPNPTTGQITLDLERTQQQIQLELFDLQGRLLRSQSFSQQSQINWQLGEQPAGLYLLRVTSEQGQANLKIILR